MPFLLIPVQDIPLDRQRLIFQGKVMNNDRKISDYGEHSDGTSPVLSIM